MVGRVIGITGSIRLSGLRRDFTVCIAVGRCGRAGRWSYSLSFRALLASSATVVCSCAAQVCRVRGLSRIGTVSHVWVSRGLGLADLAALPGSLGCECRLGEGLVDNADRDSHGGGDGADGFAACAAGEDGGSLVAVDDWSPAPDLTATTCGF